MDLFKILLYTHATLGGIALISGFIAAILSKGSRWHIKMGATFHNTMLGSIFLSLIIACLPEHINPFLFCIGIFSAYSVIAGKRCLKSNKPNFNIKTDTYLAYSIIIVGVIMISVGIYLKGDLQIILSIFGVLAIISGYSDYKAYINIELYKSNRIEHHIRKITGGYVAAFTAFMVVNGLLPGLWSWFLPTVIGAIYAIYWTRKWRENASKSVPE
jgi:hypothetical protein